MKKKILLFISLISAFVCLFAISSSAATRKDLNGIDREIIIYDDAPAKTNIETSIDDVVIFDDGFCCPSAYIFKDSKSTPNGQWTMSFMEATDFDFLKEKGKSYTFANVVELDVPNGITYLGSYSAYQNTTLKKITIPYSVSSIGSCLFEGASALQYCIFENGGNPNIKTLPTYTFGSCSNLQSFSMPDSITKIAGESCFSGCRQLKALHLSNSLEIIEGGGQQKAPFDNCNNMYFINEFFDGNTIPEKPTVYYFPSNLSSISDTCIFRWCHNLNDVLVIGKELTSVPNRYTFENNSANTIVFLGNMVNVNSNNWGTKTIYFANSADKSASDIETYVNSKTTYFCNAEGNTNHLVSDKKDLVSEATCVDYAVYATKCYCGKTLGNVNGTELDPNNHDLENATLVSIVYAKYTDKGVKKVACGRSCGENIDLDVDAIFKTLGYSIKNDGCGITNDYEINVDALNEYKEYLADNGKTFTFGVFIGNSEYFTGDAFVNADGTMDNSFSYIQAVNSLDYSKVKCTVADFTLAEKALPLVMGIYVIDDGKVSYVQHEGTYEKEITKGDVTLDVVTITKIADLSDIDLTLPETKALPVENKEN